MHTHDQKTILLVEADPAPAERIAAMLTKIGYAVITAATGTEGVRIAVGDTKIDLILMDVEPVGSLSGSDAARDILAQYAIPIVFLTSQSARESVEHLRGIPRYGYVIKESGPLVLQSSIEIAFELFETHRRLTNELAERKQAEEAHRLSEARFRSLFENSPNGIIISDPESLIIVDCNANAASMNGYACDELIGQSLNMLHTDEVASAVVDAVFREKHLDGLHGGVVTTEGIHRRKDGSQFPIESSYSLITLGDKQYVMGIDRDITKRKRTEEALLESEAIFTCFMDHSPIYVFFKDEHIRSLRLSRNYEKMLGQPVEKLLGKTMDDLFPSDLAKAMIADDTKILHEEKEVVVEEELNGRYYTSIKFPIHIKGRPTYLAGFTIDITERKLAENALRTSKILLEQTFEQSPVAMMLVSMPDRVIRMANPACVKFLRMEDEPSAVNTELSSLNVTWQDFGIDGTPATPGNLPLPRSLMGLTTDAEERYIIRKDGTLRYELVYGMPIFDDDGRLVAGYCIMLDITERKLSEQLLAQERERLAVTLRSIGDGVITTDTDGRVMMLNKAAEEMTGWRSDDAAGRPLPEVFQIVNELTRERCDNPVEKVMSSGNIIELTNHTCLLSKDGREIVIADSGAPIRDNESRITGVVLVFRDVTEKQRLNESLARAQKLESLGILAGGIAHDFNNLLAGIFGYVDMARDRAVKGKAEEVSKYLNKALGVFERAKALTQQLLTFSKGGTPVRKTIQLGPLVQLSASFALSGSNVTCQFDLAEDLWLCDCDENQIGQAVDNIVINGKQAMPMGGTMTITVANVTNRPGHPGRHVRISILDHGIGMPKEILPNIFDPFFSTKKTGHGLGLATVFSIIKRHDGWIDVESTPGKGSAFHIYLPASQKSETSATPDEISTFTGTGTILVMDDEEFMLEIVDEMLQEMGYTVVVAKNGQEALALFSDAEVSGHPFVASILDLTIPGGSGGKEVAAELRKIDPHAVIVASSGYSEHPVISNPSRNGFTDSIIKPYRKGELTNLMRRVVKR